MPFSGGMLCACVVSLIKCKNMDKTEQINTFPTERGYWEIGQ